MGTSLLIVIFSSATSPLYRQVVVENYPRGNIYSSNIFERHFALTIHLSQAIRLVGYKGQKYAVSFEA